MKKRAGIVLAAIGFFVSSSAAGISALADTSIGYTSVNVLAGISEENISVTDLEGNEVELRGGPHGGTGAKSVFVDGVILSGQTASLQDADGNGVIGYVTIDAGEEFVVNRVLVDIVHDWGAPDFSVELSLTADFNDPVIIYSNKPGEEFTADSSVEVSSILYNSPNQGVTFDFSPVKARYIRVTGDTYGNGRRWGYTTLGEIQMYAVEGGAPVYADVVAGKYTQQKQVNLACDVEGAEIYYTTDGSVPTADSEKYEGPITIGTETVRLRAVSYADGKYGVPFDFNYLTDEPVFTEPENACLNRTVTAYDQAGEPVEARDHNGGQTIEAVVDGRTDAGNSIQFTGLAFIQVDMGSSVWINRVLLNLWHDWVFRSVTVQVSDDASFETGVQTIFCSDVSNWAGLGAYAGSMDPDQNYDVEWIPNNSVGLTFNFEPIKGRYIRAFAQAGNGEYNSIYTELQAWTCEAPAEFTEPENACLNKTVTAYDQAGEPVEARNHNGGQTIEAVVDGRTDAGNSIQFTGLAFIQVDMGSSVWINRVLLNLWHDWVFRSVTVQVSDDASFETGVQTIFCSDVSNWAGLGAYAGSMDPDQNYDVEWIPNNSVGLTFNFEPIKGRYIRAFAQAGSGEYNSVYTELQAWTCAAPGSQYQYESYLSSVEGVDDVEVYCNLAFDEIGLPDTLLVSLSDGTQREIACSWSSEDYDMSSAGEYTAICSATDEADYYGLLRNIAVRISVKEVDLSALQAMIGTADEVALSDYTTTTASALTSANDAAKALNAQTYKTQAEVDAAYNLLTAAYNALALRGNTAALGTLVDAVEDYAAGDYTATTFGAFAEALAEAQAAAADGGNADLDQAQVDALLSALDAAADALVLRAVQGDYDALSAAGTAMSAKIADEDTVTVSSLAEIKAYLAEAEAYLAATASEREEISAAEVQALTVLLSGEPERRGSTAALRAYFDECEETYGYSETDTHGYFIGTYAAYLDSMYAAEALFADGATSDMTQADIDVYLSDLQAKAGALVPHADRTDFDAAMERAAGIKQADYTVSSYAAFLEAYNEVKPVYDKAASWQLQEETDAALATISAALDGLVELGDKAGLNEYIALYSAELAEDYTKNSFAAYEEALYAANRAKRSDDVSQEEVDAAAEGLKAAYEALAKLGDVGLLAEPLNEAKAIDASALTQKQAEDLQKAIEYAQSLVDFDGEVTETQVAEAAALLETAVGNTRTQNSEGGCGSTLGAGLGIAAMGIAVLIGVSRKKRCDNEKN